MEIIIISACLVTAAVVFWFEMTVPPKDPTRAYCHTGRDAQHLIRYLQTPNGTNEFTRKLDARTATTPGLG